MAHLATPAQRAEIDDLLHGLGDDDFDFDMGDGDSPGDSPLTAARVPSKSPEPFPGAYATPSPPPADIPVMVSFATAGGRALPPPSESAMKRARKIVSDAERDVDIDSGERKRPRLTQELHSQPLLSQRTPATNPTSLPLSQASPPLSQHTPAPLMLPPDAFVTPVETRTGVNIFDDSGPSAGLSSPTKPSGFRMASGNAAPAPSSEARARAMALFSDSQSEASGSQCADQPSSAFQLASGDAAPPAATSRAQVLALLGEDPQPPTTTAPTGFQLGSGRAAPPPTADAANLARARALFEDSDERPPSPPAPTPSSFRQPPSTPQRPNSPSFTAPRPVHSMSGGLPPSTPSRMPLHPMAPNAIAGPSTPAPVKLPKRIDIRTPVAGTPRRIGLGMGFTPTGKKPRKGFVTPFKVPGAIQSPNPITPSGLRAPVAPAPAPPKEERSWEPVFNLQPRPNRVTMRAAGFLPGFYTPDDLATMGYPDEIWLLTLNNALYYQFIAEDASPLGNAQALARLKYEGCKLVTAKWVDNHWRLILWKLAGQVKAKPSAFDDKWNWYEVLCQLKYRYEREYGAAERPIVRRIQEHDSSPSLPMVLCVSGIHHPPPVMNEKDEPVPQKPFLDLTDGWYHIRALTDDCLARAIQKGKIKVGRKLGVSGAKLESGADGADVLEAYEKSHLVLSGNSTHLARWDARLGVQRAPFVAGLASLSLDGGPIVLMDIILNKVFPLAYVNGDRGSPEGPWNEEEEQSRADAWKDRHEAETQRLQEEMKKNLEKIEDLAGMLASAAEDVSGPINSEAPDSIDSDFDDLLEVPDTIAMARLRSFSASTIVHLARHATRRVNDAVVEERDTLERSLRDACPPRDVRDFRIVRFSDALVGQKEVTRSGLLQVWDARALGDSLAEGRRYVVSNLIPGRNGDWSQPKSGVVKEVYLHTRRDTRWKSVE